MTTAMRDGSKQAAEEEELIPQRLLTAADLAAMPGELPSGAVRYELRQGELIIMPPPPGDEHGKVEGRITTLIGWFGDFAGLGEVRAGESGIRLRTGPDTVVGADAASRDQLPVETTLQGWLITVPAIVVEVVSKSDTRPGVQDKVNQYLEAGVRLVWVADPRRRTITIHRRDQSAVVLTESDTLTGEDIIPGLSCPVGRLFA